MKDWQCKFKMGSRMHSSEKHVKPLLQILCQHRFCVLCSNENPQVLSFIPLNVNYIIQMYKVKLVIPRKQEENNENNMKFNCL